MVGHLGSIGHRGTIAKTHLVMRPSRGSSALSIWMHHHGQQKRGRSEPAAKLPLIA